MNRIMAMNVYCPQLFIYALQYAWLYTFIILLYIPSIITYNKRFTQRAVGVGLNMKHWEQMIVQNIGSAIIR